MSAPALSGRLGFAEVGRYLPHADELAAGGTLDLSQLTQADSAGLSLLLELQRRARRRNSSLQLRNAPAQLQQLAEFFGLAPLLNFTN